MSNQANDETVTVPRESLGMYLERRRVWRVLTVKGKPRLVSCELLRQQGSRWFYRDTKTGESWRENGSCWHLTPIEALESYLRACLAFVGVCTTAERERYEDAVAGVLHLALKMGKVPGRTFLPSRN